VVNGRVAPSEYSRTLVDAVRLLRGGSLREMALLSPVGGSHIEARVRSLLDRRTRHGAIGWPTRLVAALALLVCSTLLLALPAIARPRKIPPAVALGSDSLTREKLEPFLDPLFAREMKQHQVPGAVILVMHEGKTVFTKGYGLADVARARPVVPERTIFRIGSISKVVTAVALLQMIDAGKAALDDDVNMHLEKFHVDDTFPEPVRLKNLLTHTAGFDQLGYGRHVLAREQETPLADFLKNNLVRVRPPGEITCYDTYAVTLAGYLVEVLSGEPYHRYIEKHIFEPLAMTRSEIYVPEALKDDVAVGYSGTDALVAERWEFMNTDPASTINSTATDMARFMQMLMGDGEVDGHRILSAESSAGIKKRQFGNHPCLPGFTWLLWEDTTYGINALSHGGSMTGFACFMYLLPANEIGIFVAVNREDGSMVHAILSPLVEMLLRTGAVDASLEESFTRAPERQPSVRVDVPRFLGMYADSGYNHSRPQNGGWSKDPFEVIADAHGRLMFGGLPCEPLQPLLFERKDGLLIAFRENEKGEITHMLVRQSVYEKLPKSP
jgi:CubicO group peptidase (beta-lactamase class C family)